MTKGLTFSWSRRSKIIHLNVFNSSQGGFDQAKNSLILTWQQMQPFWSKIHSISGTVLRRKFQINLRLKLQVTNTCYPPFCWYRCSEFSGCTGASLNPLRFARKTSGCIRFTSVTPDKIPVRTDTEVQYCVMILEITPAYNTVYGMSDTRQWERLGNILYYGPTYLMFESIFFKGFWSLEQHNAVVWAFNSQSWSRWWQSNTSIQQRQCCKNKQMQI